MTGAKYLDVGPVQGRPDTVKNTQYEYFSMSIKSQVQGID